MSNKTIKVISITLLITAAVFIFVFSIRSISEVKNEPSDEFAICLTDSGAVIYGTEWCGHCRDQKKMFGDSFSEINFVDCDLQLDECIGQGIQGYPTWKIDGQAYSGVQSFEELSQLTGCSLPQ